MTKKKLVLLLLDLFLITLSYCVAYILRFELDDALSYKNFISTSLPIVAVVTLLVFIKMGMYKAVWRYASVDCLITTIKAVTISIVLSVVLIYFVQTYRIPRSIFIIYWLLFLVLAGGTRFSPRIYRHYITIRKMEGLKVLVYGAGASGQMIVREMMHNHVHGYNPVCFVDDNSKKIGRSIHGLPIYSGSDGLHDIVKGNNIECVLIAIPSASGEKIRNIIDSCEVSQIKFKIIQSFSNIVTGNINTNEIRDIEIDDLLMRAPNDLDIKCVADMVSGKSVLITGAGGTIGSELTRQVSVNNPSALMLVDNNEYGLYKIDSELNRKNNGCSSFSILGDIGRSSSIEDHMRRNATDIIFHSAAYKHVSLVEDNPCESIINNIHGTVNVAKLANNYKVKKFVFVSTDKAVRPTSVMGATKRLCELYIQNFNNISETEFVAVRFGNVLNSSGSVVPKFKQQIENGGPVTISHPDATRYFMLIPEAVQLIIQAGSIGKGGEIFILDMGTAVNIEKMAKEMIMMMGYSLEDIMIEYSGLKPGEKLHEELFLCDTNRETEYDSIAVAGNTEVDWEEFERDIEDLMLFSKENNVDAVIRMLKKIVPEYNPENEIYKAALKATKCAP
jgi:FlaA1/EpsC-like NDP-sugar epimerase